MDHAAGRPPVRHAVRPTAAAEPATDVEQAADVDAQIAAQSVAYKPKQRTEIAATTTAIAKARADLNQLKELISSADVAFGASEATREAMLDIAFSGTAVLRLVIDRQRLAADKLLVFRLMDNEAMRSTTCLRVYTHGGMASSQIVELMKYVNEGLEKFDNEPADDGAPSLVPTFIVGDGGSENVDLYTEPDGDPRTILALGRHVDIAVNEWEKQMTVDVKTEHKGREARQAALLKRAALLWFSVVISDAPARRPFGIGGWAHHGARGSAWDGRLLKNTAKGRFEEGARRDLVATMNEASGEGPWDQMMTDGFEQEAATLSKPEEIELEAQLYDGAAAVFAKMASQTDEDTAIAQPLTNPFDTELADVMTSLRPPVQRTTLVDKMHEAWEKHFKAVPEQEEHFPPQTAERQSKRRRTAGNDEPQFEVHGGIGDDERTGKARVGSTVWKPVPQEKIPPPQYPQHGTNEARKMRTLDERREGIKVSTSIRAGEGGRVKVSLETVPCHKRIKVDTSISVGEGGRVKVLLELKPRSKSAPMLTAAQLRLQWMMAAVADGAEAAADVTPRMVFDEVKVALMDRRRLEMARYEGLDLLRHVYAIREGDQPRVYCATHLQKCSVQGLAGKKQGDVACVLNVDNMRNVAKELEAENPQWYHALVAALEHTTDMQSQAALTYLMIEPVFCERLKERGHKREWAWAKLMGFVVAAYDMPGLTQPERTRILEQLHMLFIYNLVGDQLYLPFGGGKDQAKGVRARDFRGLAASNILGYASNVGVRAWLRHAKPEAYKHLNEKTFSQNDVENYNSEISQQLGFKPEEAKVEARTARFDYRDAVRHDESRRNFPLRGSAEKYDMLYYSDDHSVLAWWNNGRALRLLSEGRWNYYIPISKRARADAKTRTASVRSHHKAYRIATG